MRAAFSMVSLLVVVALVAYFYTAQPVLQSTDAVGGGNYQRLQQKAETAAAQLAGHNNAQADVDAATNPATNAPASAPGN